MKTNTLVIIDMQPSTWGDACRAKGVIPTIKKEITKAIQSRSGIIFVEYRNNGKTHAELLAHAKGYGRKTIVEKNINDGSTQIIDACKKRHFAKNRFRVCGILTDCCVHATVLNLSDKLPKAAIEVVLKGCHPQDKNAWSTMASRDNVKIKKRVA